MKINLYKVKEGKLDQLLKWGGVLMNEKNKEAIESIIEEKVTREFVVVFPYETGHLAIGFMDGECLKGSDSELNIEHRKIMRDSLEFISDGKVVYELLIK